MIRKKNDYWSNILVILYLGLPLLWIIFEFYGHCHNIWINTYFYNLISSIFNTVFLFPCNLYRILFALFLYTYEIETLFVIFGYVYDRQYIISYLQKVI